MVKFDAPPVIDRSRPPYRLALGICVVLLCATLSIFVFGWVVGVEGLMQPLDGHPAIAPRTVLAFALASATLIWRLRGGDHRWVAALALMVAGVAGMEGAEFAWHEQEWRSNDMAEATEIGFYVVSFCLFTFDARVRAFEYATLAAVAGGLAWSALPILWFGAGSRALLQSPLYEEMAPHTVLSFFLLYLALVLGHHARGTRPLRGARG